MAIFIFPTARSLNSAKFKVAAAFCGLLMISPVAAFGAGYVISSKDRARAAELSQQAYVTFQSGDYAQALGLLVQADQLRPDQPDGWNLRGVILLKQKAYDPAQAAFARAAALDPGLWAAQFNLAEVLFQRKDYARARTRFEKLLTQTDRYKEGNKWELVQYKACLSALLMGDEPAAVKKLAKLPASGGATPAFLYAQAAVNFHRKNAAQAQKSLAAAQSIFPVAINDLFSGSLVQAGWQTPPSPMPSAALAVNNASPSGPLLPGSDSRTTAYVVDPQLQAASAGPLPVADAPMRPVVMPTIPTSRNAPPLVETKPKDRPPVPTVAVQKPSAAVLDTGSDLENGGLLLLDSGF